MSQSRNIYVHFNKLKQCIHQCYLNTNLNNINGWLFHLLVRVKATQSWCHSSESTHAGLSYNYFPALICSNIFWLVSGNRWDDTLLSVSDPKPDTCYPSQLRNLLIRSQNSHQLARYNSSQKDNQLSLHFLDNWEQHTRDKDKML